MVSVRAPVHVPVQVVRESGSENSSLASIIARYDLKEDGPRICRDEAEAYTVVSHVSCYLTCSKY